MNKSKLSKLPIGTVWQIILIIGFLFSIASAWYSLRFTVQDHEKRITGIEQEYKESNSVIIEMLETILDGE